MQLPVNTTVRLMRCSGGPGDVDRDFFAASIAQHVAGDFPGVALATIRRAVVVRLATELHDGLTVTTLSVRSRKEAVPLRPQQMMFVRGSSTGPFPTLVVSSMVGKVHTAVCASVCAQFTVVMAAVAIPRSLMEACVDGVAPGGLGDVELVFGVETEHGALLEVAVSVPHRDLAQLGPGAVVASVLAHVHKQTAVDLDRVACRRVRCGVCLLTSDGRLRLHTPLRDANWRVVATVLQAVT